MRANPFYYGQVLWRGLVPAMRPVLSGISVALVFGGCATHPPLGVTSGNVQPLPEPLRLQLGTIALAPVCQSAQVSFDLPAGQTATFGEGASVAAARLLAPTGFSHDPGDQAVVGVAGSLAAPVVAVAAGRSAAHQRLAPDKLVSCESNLLFAMKTMAAQERFRDCLLQAANENTRRRLIPLEPTSTPGTACPEANTVLETQVRQLRLERTGKNDTSYALRIEAKVRLLRAADSNLLYEVPVSWRSDTCLFVDWTLSDSFQKVTQTAYREMAERLVAQLFLTTPEGPLLAGAGYPQAAARKSKATQLAAINRGSLRSVGLQPVSYPAMNTGTIGIYPTDEFHSITVQRPPTKDEAATEAVEEMNCTFDGLYNHPNPFIFVPSILVGVPVGLWKQSVAVASGLTERQARQADAQLYAAVRGVHPHKQLAAQVAQTLAAQTGQIVVLLQPPPPGVDAETALVQSVGRRTLVSQPKGRLVTNNAVQPDTVLEIHVVSATLAAEHGLNPPLALSVEVQARLRRAADGAEIYACPVHYRSQAHKFTRWAAHDAQLFRQELQACYREVGAAVVAQLAARNLVRPERLPASLVAGN